jgi:hypothetical protein
MRKGFLAAVAAVFLMGGLANGQTFNYIYVAAPSQVGQHIEAKYVYGVTGAHMQLTAKMFLIYGAGNNSMMPEIIYSSKNGCDTATSSDLPNGDYRCSVRLICRDNTNYDPTVPGSGIYYVYDSPPSTVTISGSCIQTPNTMYCGRNRFTSPSVTGGNVTDVPYGAWPMSTGYPACTCKLTVALDGGGISFWTTDETLGNTNYGFWVSSTYTHTDFSITYTYDYTFSMTTANTGGLASGSSYAVLTSCNYMSPGWVAVTIP